MASRQNSTARSGDFRRISTLSLRTTRRRVPKWQSASALDRGGLPHGKQRRARRRRKLRLRSRLTVSMFTPPHYQRREPCREEQTFVVGCSLSRDSSSHIGKRTTELKGMCLHTIQVFVLVPDS